MNESKETDIKDLIIAALKDKDKEVFYGEELIEVEE